MTESRLAISYECVPIVEIDVNEADKSPIEAIVETIARLEGVDPTELPPLHESIEPMSFRLLLAHARRHTSSAMVICFSYADWNVFARGDGTIIVGDPDEQISPTPLF